MNKPPPDPEDMTLEEAEQFELWAESVDREIESVIAKALAEGRDPTEALNEHARQTAEAILRAEGDT